MPYPLRLDYAFSRALDFQATSSYHSGSRLIQQHGSHGIFQGSWNIRVILKSLHHIRRLLLENRLPHTSYLGLEVAHTSLHPVKLSRTFQA